MNNKDVGVMIGEIYDDIVEYVSPYENEVLTVLVNKCLEFGIHEKELPVEFINNMDDLNELIENGEGDI